MTTVKESNTVQILGGQPFHFMSSQFWPPLYGSLNFKIPSVITETKHIFLVSSIKWQKEVGVKAAYKINAYKSNTHDTTATNVYKISNI